MVDLRGFDATTIEPNAPRAVIPAGIYQAVIVASDEKPTKAQTGSFIELTLEIIEGEQHGKKLVDRLNINNPNDEAVRIANGTLSAICHAVGVLNPEDSSDLHDKPLAVTVKVKEASGNYGASNEIGGYAPIKKATNGASNGAATAKSTAAAPAEKTKAPPWNKGKK